MFILKQHLTALELVQKGGTLVLMTARPWRHPDSGIFYLCKVVPDDLRPILKKREEKVSLGTREPSEARRLHASALADLEQRWANARRPKTSLSEKQAHEIATLCIDELLLQFGENPTQFPAGLRLAPTFLADLAPGMEMEGVRPTPFHSDPTYLAPRALPVLAKGAYAWCRSKADDYARRRGLLLDDASEVKLIKAIANACGVVGCRLEATAKELSSFASLAQATSFGQQPAPTIRQSPSVTISSLFNSWSAERRPVAKTAYMWERVCNSFAHFIGHDDARAVTKLDVIQFKDSLVTDGLTPKTIREGKLAPLRAIFAWGFKNNRLELNPAAGVDIAVRYKAGEQRRGYSDEEAAKILNVALTQTGMLKWAPWLCAYSGARLSEIAQLRATDVVDLDDVCCLKLMPEAGSLKNRASERVVPVHSAVLSIGFRSFVTTLSDGVLFAEVAKDRFENRGGIATKRIGAWVRELGIKDPRISPSHSWRHRFKTLARRHGLAPDIVDAICGHSSRTVADAYGEFPISALKREIEKLPPPVV